MYLCIYWNLLWFIIFIRWKVFISIVFLLYLLNIYLFIYYYIYSYLLDWIYFLLSNTCTIKFIEGKFYFEARTCYIGKTMPTCIE